MALTVSLFILISALMIIAASVLIVLQIILSLGSGCLIAAYALIAASFVTLAVSDHKTNVSSKAFELYESVYMRIVAYLCAVGFGIDTVAYLLNIYDCISGKAHTIAAIPLFSLSTVFALLSAFEMVLVAMSFSGSKYNFKRFLLIAFTPLLWAAVKISYMLLGYVDVSNPADLLKAIVVAAELLFFYRFAYEVYKDGIASRLTLYFADVLTMCGVLYFVSRAALLIADSKSFFDYDNVFAVVVLFTSVFSFTLKFRIVKYVQ